MHRNRFHLKIDPVKQAGAVDARKALRCVAITQMSQVKVDRPAAQPREFADDGPRHHIAGCKLLAFVIARHEALHVGVAQDRALSAQGFRQQETRSALEEQRCRVELDHLHVGDDRPCAVGHGHPVPGGNIRVRGLSVDPPDAAGGEEHGAGVDRHELALLFIPGERAANRSVFDE